MQGDLGNYVNKTLLPLMRDLVVRYQPSILFPDGEWTDRSEVR